MSCDFGVWFPHRRLSNREAGELYVCLCESDISGVQPHPAVDAFYAELTAKHPEIDTVPEDRIDDHDYCPWSCALDRSPAHVIMTCVWPKADMSRDLCMSLLASTVSPFSIHSRSALPIPMIRRGLGGASGNGTMKNRALEPEV